MRKLYALILALSLLWGLPTAAQSDIVAPYDSRLNRLAEVLGSVHYLSNLCGEQSNQWREQMEQMLVLERPEPNRRARLIASFNRGFRSFDSVYSACTAQASGAASRYIEEGIALSAEITARYSE